MRKYLYTIGVAVLFISCKTTTNQISYFQDIDKLMVEQSAAGQTNYRESTIAPDDILSITVSSLDPNAVAIFNLPLVTSIKPGTQEASVTPVMQSYLVDAKGCIDFPVLGRMEVAGHTRSELTELMKEKIGAYVKSPIVTINIMNFKVSVLGEVNRPGTIPITGERVSILDAISLAGDLSIYGARENVLLIRDHNGEKTIHRFDLTSSDVLSSPYYYLQQNDVVYVEPNKARRGNAKYNQSSQFNVSVASAVISALSVLASLTIALIIK